MNPLNGESAAIVDAKHVIKSFRQRLGRPIWNSLRRAIAETSRDCRQKWNVLNEHNVGTQLNFPMLLFERLGNSHHVSLDWDWLGSRRFAFECRYVFAEYLLSNHDIFLSHRAILDHIGSDECAKIFDGRGSNCVIELPCCTRLLNLSFRKVVLVLGNSLGETEIVFMIVVTIDTRFAGTKQNLLPILGVDMESVVAISIVEHHVELGLQIVETEDIGERPAIMPDLSIFCELSLPIALQDAAICVQDQTSWILGYVFQ